MAKSPTIHYNPPDMMYGKTRCGLSLFGKEWRTDPDDVTCNNCIRGYKADVRKGITIEEV